MKDEEAQTTSANGGTAANKKEGSSSEAGLFGGRGKYKFWALAAILLLAFWSMFTGSVTLKWSAGHLTHGSDDLDSPMHRDLDILEVEEREKLVRHMWEVYTQSKNARLPLFWREAFEAAYEDLTSGDTNIRNNAISEIAKMSLVRSALKHEPEPTTTKSR
ncbi:OLC1v1017955C1 [Oldenlandia corymbosa var. corymbosa]|uniref:OLC1v1017955C1 n=1 Tax=Oldenlandia corymbosa var. corymbosa TaxID=529605 RepID=A0AAV1EAR8_OLDCO|nr:OLC1v1017955C1 [Oldenlandia corymbosa var. corymbosa]